MKQMVDGIKVLDFSITPGANGATALMTDQGATVIKIEAPETGDPIRKESPFVDGVSLKNCWYNRGKKSVTIDLDDVEGVSVVKKMAADADVIVESFSPGFMDEIGLGYDEINIMNPKIIYCSVTPFGQKGSYCNKPGNDLIVQAMSGIMEITGDADGPPMKHGFPFSDLTSANAAYSSIIAALCNREFTSEGQYIDVPALSTLIWINSAVDRGNVNQFSRREGNHHMSLAPYGLFRGKNGQSVIIAAINVKTWMSVCEALGRPDLVDDERFNTVNARTNNRLELVSIIEEWLNKFDDIKDAASLLEQAGAPSTKVHNVKDILTDPHNNEVGWFVKAETSDDITSMKEYLSNGTNAEYSKVPGTIKKAPTLGQNNYEILMEYGLTKKQIDSFENK